MAKRIIPLLLFISLGFGQDCTASDGTDGVTVFGNCYSIENTTTISIDIFVGGTGVGDTIPRAIGLLTNLTTLKLRGALRTSEPRIGNVIPPEICHLTNLEILDLTDNEFGCHQYNWLGDWATDNCNELCSETDECNATIPNQIGYLTNLEGLWLSDNHLSGEIPSSIGNLINLRSLGLRDNDLTGSIPSQIGNLTQLHVFDMADNQLGCYEYDFNCEPSPWYDNRDFTLKYLQIILPFRDGSIRIIREARKRSSILKIPYFQIPDFQIPLSRFPKSMPGGRRRRRKNFWPRPGQ